MKISNISISNFRQYYGIVEINLQTSGDKNIILIGGKNGYGKTNLLLSLVWCLYGEKLTQIDENFKKEVQKETNYSRYMKQSLNWTAKNEGKQKFSVSLLISGVEIPDAYNVGKDEFEISITREYDTSLGNPESLSIKDANTKKELFDEEDNKISFINDYLIPLDAAKFIFFDAEKIASLAELSAKEEGSVLNDALGKLLGLDTYEDLIEDLKAYSNSLKKEAANVHIKEQLTNTENAIKLNKNLLEDLDLKIAQNESLIDESKLQVKKYELFLNQHSKKGTSIVDREVLYSKRTLLEQKVNDLEIRFNEMSELLPLAILTGKLEEVKEHLELQNIKESSVGKGAEIHDNLELFIEKLFNAPPDPSDGSMSFKNKAFYWEKAKSLIPAIFDLKEESVELKFEHDLNNADKNLVLNSLQAIHSYANSFLDSSLDEYNAVKFDLNEVNRQLKKADSNLDDELVTDYSAQKDTTLRKIEKLIEEAGGYKEQKLKLNSDIARLSQKYQSLIQKVQVSERNKEKLNIAKSYLAAVQLFVDKEKEAKTQSLEKSILSEMQTLMHKLKQDDNFISDVEVSILPDGAGMKVSLYDSQDNEIHKEVLSQGEKQLYISCLIKAILNEAIQDFPIFIDTPLGRLDDEHIKNILLYYYPNLSQQVVILSTNNEVTSKRYKTIESFVSTAYLLENSENNTTLRKGYFSNYED